jgi:hypothetical protein
MRVCLVRTVRFDLVRSYAEHETAPQTCHRGRRNLYQTYLPIEFAYNGYPRNTIRAHPNWQIARNISAPELSVAFTPFSPPTCCHQRYSAVLSGTVISYSCPPIFAPRVAFGALLTPASKHIRPQIAPAPIITAPTTPCLFTVYSMSEIFAIMKRQASSTLSVSKF